MALPINPIARAASIASASVEKEMQAAAGAISGITGVDTGNLADLTNKLGAGVGSGLNGFASGISSIGDAAGAALGGAQSSILGAAGALGSNAVTGALGGLGSAIQSGVGGLITSGQNALGSIGANITKGIDSIAAGAKDAISSVAGQIDDIASLKRGKNVPKGAELFTAAGAGIKLSPASSNDWRVAITTDFSIFDSPLFKRLATTGGVVFPYLPQISISTQANYTQVDPTHNNYPFQSYKNSQVSEISIAGEFSCETAADAEYWIAATTFFKTATKMFFGQGANVGNPPIICNLNGYGTSIFDNVPVVIKSFSVDLPKDVNYVNYNGINGKGSVATNTWVPILSTITITVMPIYNRERLRQFSLESYARGEPSKNGVGFI
jgi:hypothetical protein